MKKGRIRVVCAWNGVEKHVQRPSSIQQLKQSIHDAFSIDGESDDITITDMDSHDLSSDEKLQSCDTVVFQRAGRSSQQLHTAIESEISIIPNSSILTNSGDEHDFHTALGELIDNAIQYTRDNDPTVGRRVEVTFFRGNDVGGVIDLDEESTSSRLVVLDNGCGMSFEGLRRWATMGVSSYSKESDSSLDPDSAMDADGAGPSTTVQLSAAASKYLTSDFSRYGVGSKRAIFNLGDTVTVRTRARGSRWCHEVTLSKALLESSSAPVSANSGGLSGPSDGSSAWKATVRACAMTPEEEERGWESFTCITIEEIRDLYVLNFDSRRTRRSLAHMYHYYIHGSNGNHSNTIPIHNSGVYSSNNSSSAASMAAPAAAAAPSTAPAAEKPGKKQSKSKRNAAASDDAQQRQKEAEHLVDLVVDGKNLRECVLDDLESNYLSNAACEFTCDLKLSVKLDARFMPLEPATQMLPMTQAAMPSQYQYSEMMRQAQQQQQQQEEEAMANRLSATVHCHLYYFPFKDGKESLPVPHTLLSRFRRSTLPSASSSSSSVVSADIDASIPLTDREPGFEVFWNGRLLPHEIIRSLPFMRRIASDGFGIPEISFRRLKGMMFVDSHFDVSSNKLLLRRETPLAQGLLDFDDRKLSQEFRKWLRDSHRLYDQDIIYVPRPLPDGPSSASYDAMKLYFDEVRIASASYKINDFVALKTRPKIVGQIVDLWRDAMSESAGCQVKIHEYAPLNASAASSSSSVAGDRRESMHSINKLAGILSADDYRVELEKLTSKKPANLDILETAGLSLMDSPDSADDSLPVYGPIKAGSHLQNSFAVAVFSAEGKPLAKLAFPISLKVSLHQPYKCSANAEPKTDKSPLVSLVTEQPQQGKFLFTLPADFVFIAAGIYKVEFKCDESVGVRSKSIYIQVNPSAPKGLNILPFSAAKGRAALGSPLPAIQLSFVDAYQNAVPFPFSAADEAQKHLVIQMIRSKVLPRKPPVPLSDEWKLVLSEDKTLLSIENVEIVDGFRLIGFEESVSVKVSMNSLPSSSSVSGDEEAEDGDELTVSLSASSSITLFPGPPARLGWYQKQQRSARSVIPESDEEEDEEADEEEDDDDEEEEGIQFVEENRVEDDRTYSIVKIQSPPQHSNTSLPRLKLVCLDSFGNCILPKHQYPQPLFCVRGEGARSTMDASSSSRRKKAAANGAGSTGRKKKSAASSSFGDPIHASTINERTGCITIPRGSLMANSSSALSSAVASSSSSSSSSSAASPLAIPTSVQIVLEQYPNAAPLELQFAVKILRQPAELRLSMGNLVDNSLQRIGAGSYSLSTLVGTNISEWSLEVLDSSGAILTDAKGEITVSWLPDSQDKLSLHDGACTLPELQAPTACRTTSYRIEMKCYQAPEASASSGGKGSKKAKSKKDSSKKDAKRKKDDKKKKKQKKASKKKTGQRDERIENSLPNDVIDLDQEDDEEGEGQNNRKKKKVSIAEDEDEDMQTDGDDDDHQDEDEDKEEAEEQEEEEEQQQVEEERVERTGRVVIGKTISCTLQLITRKGPPAAFRFANTKSLKSVKCFESFAVTVVAVDEFGNMLHAEYDAVEYPRLSSLTPQLRVFRDSSSMEVDSSSSSAARASQLRSALSTPAVEMLGESGDDMEITITSKGAWHITGATVAGKSGSIRLSVTDANGALREDHIMLDLLPGPAAALRVDDNKEISCSANSFDLIPPFTVTLYDDYGNKLLANGKQQKQFGQDEESSDDDDGEDAVHAVKNGGAIQVEMSNIPPPLRIYSAETNNSKAKKKGRGRAAVAAAAASSSTSISLVPSADGTCFHLPARTFVAGPVGEHVLTFNAPGLQVETARIKLHLFPSRIPTSIRFAERIHQTIAAGALFPPISVVAVDAQGKAVQAPSAPELKIIDPSHSKRPLLVSDEQQQHGSWSYSFPDLESNLYKAGTWNFEAVLDMSQCEWAPLLQQDDDNLNNGKLAINATVQVQAGAAVKLMPERPNLVLPAVSNDPDAASAKKRELVDDLEVWISDAFGNLVPSSSSIQSLRLSLIPAQAMNANAMTVSQAAIVPELEVERAIKPVVAGRVRFGRVAIRAGSGSSSGPCALIIQPVFNNSIPDSLAVESSLIEPPPAAAFEPLRLEFLFTEDARRYEEHKKLQDQALSCKAELEERQAAVRTTEETLAFRQTEVETLRCQRDRMRKELEAAGFKLNTSWDKITGEKLLSVVDKKIETRRKSEADDRNKMNSSSQRSGEGSGASQMPLGRRKVAYVGADRDKGLAMVSKAFKEYKGDSAPNSAAASGGEQEATSVDGVIGFIGEIGMIEDDKIERAIANQFPHHMQTIVLQNSKAMEHWKAMLGDSRCRLLAMDLVSRPAQGLDEAGKIRFGPMDASVSANGLIGHVTNLIDIRPEHQRITVHRGLVLSSRVALYALYGDTLLFDTAKNAIAYRQKVVSKEGRRCPTIICLDGDKIEGNGVTSSGSKSSQETRFFFAKTSLASAYSLCGPSPDLKRLLNMRDKASEYSKIYDQLLVAEGEEGIILAQQQFDDAKAEHEDRIRELEEMLQVLRGQLAALGAPEGCMGPTQSQAPSASQAPRMISRLSARRRAPPPDAAAPMSEGEQEEAPAPQQRKEQTTPKKPTRSSAAAAAASSSAKHAMEQFSEEEREEEDDNDDEEDEGGTEDGMEGDDDSNSNSKSKKKKKSPKKTSSKKGKKDDQKKSKKSSKRKSVDFEANEEEPEAIEDEEEAEKSPKKRARKKQNDSESERESPSKNKNRKRKTAGKEKVVEGDELSDSEELRPRLRREKR